MLRAERRDAEADEESGVVSVQIAAALHIVGDIGFCLALVEFVTDLVAGLKRRLRRGEVDVLRLDRIQELVVGSVSMCCRCWRTRQGGCRDDAGTEGPQKSARTHSATHHGPPFDAPA